MSEPIPPSRALAKVFRIRPTPDKVSLAKSLVERSTAETYEYVEEIAAEVTYAEFIEKLTIQEFERLKLLALSDEFESVTEEAKLEFLPGQNLAALRALPEYTEMKRRLREAATYLSSDENNQAWQKRTRSRVRRALVRTIRPGVDPMTAGRAAAELLDREIPKASRTNEEPRPLEISEESAARLSKALAAINKNRDPSPAA